MALFRVDLNVMAEQHAGVRIQKDIQTESLSTLMEDEDDKLWNDVPEENMPDPDRVTFMEMKITRLSR